MLLFKWKFTYHSSTCILQLLLLVHFHIETLIKKIDEFAKFNNALPTIYHWHLIKNSWVVTGSKRDILSLKITVKGPNGRSIITINPLTTPKNYLVNHLVHRLRCISFKAQIFLYRCSFGSHSSTTVGLFSIRGAEGSHFRKMSTQRIKAISKFYS